MITDDVGIRHAPRSAVAALYKQRQARKARQLEDDRARAAELAQRFTEPVIAKVRNLQRHQKIVEDDDMSRSALATMCARDIQQDLDGTPSRRMDAWLRGESSGAMFRSEE